MNGFFVVNCVNNLLISISLDSYFDNSDSLKVVFYRIVFGSFISDSFFDFFVFFFDLFYNFFIERLRSHLRFFFKDSFFYSLLSEITSILASVFGKVDTSNIFSPFRFVRFYSVSSLASSVQNIPQLGVFQVVPFNAPL